MDNRNNLDRNNLSPSSSRPFFSIIITTYNRVKLLKRALDSLILQTENDWEAIIVDDGSNVNIYSEVVPYLIAYPKITYLWKIHSGEALSKNAGIFSSSGKFISFLDSDDEYQPNHLESRKSILKQNPDARFLHGGASIIGNQYVPDRFNDEKLINLNECVIGGTFFIERSLMYQLKGFRKIYLGTDADLFDRALKEGIEIIETGQKTYIYHHETENSITNKLYNDQLQTKD